MKKLSNKNLAGFTLIEVLLNIAIVAIFMGAISSFFYILITSNARNRAISEVNQQGMQIMQLMTQTIRDAENITNPVPGPGSNSLELVFVDALKNPTYFNLTGTDLQMKETVAGNNFTINSNKTQISNLTFTNLTNTGTKGSVKIEFTINYTNPDNRSEIRYSKTFYDTATLR